MQLTERDALDEAAMKIENTQNKKCLFLLNEFESSRVLF